MEKFQSTKLFDGYSTVFRQWRARGTHCKFLHGYGTSFRVWFEGELDHRNWVWDFGGMKRATNTIEGKAPNEYFKWLLDHTTIAASDDPFLDDLLQLEEKGVLQLRIIPDVGAERFAEFLYTKIQPFVHAETEGRVRVAKVEFYEHSKNSAIYIPE